MNWTEIIEELNQLSGENPDFYAGLTPGAKPVTGVRVPNLRRLAKKIAKDDFRAFLRENTRETFELEMLQAFVIGYADPGKGNANAAEILKAFQEFIPQLHDWAVCDSLCQSFKLARTCKEETFRVLTGFADSKREFEVRAVAVTLMSHYLDEDYVDRVIDVLNHLHADSYYARMGIAWSIATMMAKFPEKCYNYMVSGDNRLDDWTYNKSIQKMIESYRIPDTLKQQMRSLKRKQ